MGQILTFFGEIFPAGTPAQLAGQILSILGMIFIVGSMQCKRMHHFYIMQFIAAVLYTTSFVLLSSLAGALLNGYGLVRAGILMGGQKWHRTPVLVGLFVLLSGACAVAFYLDGPIALLPALAQTAGTIGMWTRNGAKMRVLQFCAVSPLWLTYNILVGSIGAIACEIFNMVSVIVSLIRYGWKELLRDE